MTPRLRWLFGWQEPLPKWTGPVNREVRNQLKALPPTVRAQRSSPLSQQVNVHVLRKPKTWTEWLALYGDPS